MGGIISIGGINATYRDPGDGPLYAVDSNKETTRGDATYYCQWGDRDTLHARLLGTVIYHTQTSFLGISKGYLERPLPHQHPAKSFLYCSDAGYKPYVAATSIDANLPAGDSAIMHALYDSRSYNVDTDANMTRAIDGVTWTVDESWWTGGTFKRYVTSIPPKDKYRVWHAKGGIWTFTYSGLKSAEASFFTVNETEHVYVWHAIPIANIPWFSIQNLRRCTNLSTWNQFPAQTIVFDGYSFSKPYRPFPDGILVVDIIYTMTEKPYGANSLPDSRDGWNFHPVTSGAAARTPYSIVDPKYFRNLFRPEAAFP